MIYFVSEGISYDISFPKLDLQAMKSSKGMEMKQTWFSKSTSRNHLKENMLKIGQK